MVVSAALLVREQGAHATSVGDVLAHSGAPRGSAYHHFPGGRAQLLREATDYAAGFTAERLQRAGSARELLDGLIAQYRTRLERSEFRAGCPVVAVAVEAGDEALRQRAAAAFALWSGVIAERLVADGLEPAAANELAIVIVSAIEGAIVLARAARDPGPLDAVHRHLRALLPAPGPEGSP